MLTIEDVAKRLNVSTATVRRMIDDGELKAIRVRNQWRIREEDYEAYLQRQSQQR